MTERLTNLELADILAAALAEKGFVMTTVERNEDLFVGACAPRYGFTAVLIVDANCARINAWSDAVSVHTVTLRHEYGNEIATLLAHQIVEKIVDWIWRGGVRPTPSTDARRPT